MKLLPSSFRQLAWDRHVALETERHLLLYLFLELTRRCTLRCRHCGSDCSSDSAMGELDTASWLSIIDYLDQRASPKPAIVLTGGEPLVHPGVMEIARSLGCHGFPWGMVTNGFSLNDERLRSLVDAGIESITISWEGTEAAHTWLRRHPESHERCIRAMERIGASGIRTRDVVTCVFEDNLDHLDEAADRIASLGMNSWRLFRIFPKGRAAGEARLHLSRERSLALLRWIESARPRWATRGLDISFSCEGYLPFAQDRKLRAEPFFCRSGINIAAILCDGSVTGCNNNGPDYLQGSILQRDFFDIWETGFTEYRNHDWLKTGICADCPEWRHCQGGSVHLREKSQPGPGFCYLREVPPGS